MAATPHLVTPGSVWKHRSGATYTVLFIANDTPDPRPDYPPTVVYRGENGKHWAGRLDDWHRRMIFVTQLKRTKPHGMTEVLCEWCGESAGGEIIASQDSRTTPDKSFVSFLHERCEHAAFVYRQKGK